MVRTESVNHPLNATSSKTGRIIIINNRLSSVENESLTLIWFFSKSIKVLKLKKLRYCYKNAEPIILISIIIKKQFHRILDFSRNVFSGMGFKFINNSISQFKEEITLL